MEIGQVYKKKPDDFLDSVLVEKLPDWFTYLIKVTKVDSELISFIIEGDNKEVRLSKSLFEKNFELA